MQPTTNLVANRVPKRVTSIGLTPMVCIPFQKKIPKKTSFCLYGPTAGWVTLTVRVRVRVRIRVSVSVSVELLVSVFTGLANAYPASI